MNFWDHYRPEDFKPLECDVCKAVFGWFYILDVNGSIFVCHACRVAAMPAEPSIAETRVETTPAVCPKSYADMTQDELIEAGATQLAAAWWQQNRERFERFDINGDISVTLADGDTSKTL